MSIDIFGGRCFSIFVTTKQTIEKNNNNIE